MGLVVRQKNLSALAPPLQDLRPSPARKRVTVAQRWKVLPVAGSPQRWCVTQAVGCLAAYLLDLSSLQAEVFALRSGVRAAVGLNSQCPVCRRR